MAEAINTTSSFAEIPRQTTKVMVTFEVTCLPLTVT